MDFSFLLIFVLKVLIRMLLACLAIIVFTMLRQKL